MTVTITEPAAHQSPAAEPAVHQPAVDQPAVDQPPAAELLPAPPVDTFGLTPFLDPLRVPPVVRPVPGPDGVAALRVRMLPAWVRLHSQLPTTLAWTYEGSLPGPTVEVRRGLRTRVEWANELTGPYPVVEVTGAPVHAENRPGAAAPADPRVAALRPWTVVHLHGARVDGGSDGWTENAVGTGGVQLSEYGNDQRAGLLWYHDHALGITRLNVTAGLAGLYVVRDDEEDALGLPAGEFELPLLLADRNLDVEPDGRVSGRLLHQTEDGTGEFFGPFTTVNGTIWPHADVQPRPYRLRLLNGSNARVYRLLLVDGKGRTRHDAVRQIGTDGGLLGAPVALPDGGLLLAPAERADLLVDFGLLAGEHLTVVNTASAPFHGGPADPARDPRLPDPDPDARLTIPYVLQFRVAAGTRHRTPPPAALAGSYRRLTHDALPEHEHRLVALVEEPMPDGTTMLQLWEMDDGEVLAAPAAAGPGVVDVQAADGTVTRHRRQAAAFDDRLNWSVRQDGWEIWRILNLTGDTHPFHVHLVQFQLLGRDNYDTGGFDPAAGGTTAPVAFAGKGVIDANETGNKDVVRVNPGELVSIAAQFSGGTGRYMYHCHILEHEDRDMMRPFRVVPGDVLDISGMGDMGPMPMPMPMPM